MDILGRKEGINVADIGAGFRMVCRSRRETRGSHPADVKRATRRKGEGIGTGREPFGLRDSIGQPDIEGSGIPIRNPKQKALKAGEFAFGYPDETGSLPPMPQPDALGRNGTYVVFRKLHQRVAAFRQYLHANAPKVPRRIAISARDARFSARSSLARCLMPPPK